MNRSSIAIVATVFIALALCKIALAVDPLNGTWQLDTSKTENDNPNQMTIKSVKGGLSFQTNEQEPFVILYGKDSPAPNGSMRSTVRLNDHSLESTSKINGKVIERITTTVSADGKHLIRVSEQILAAGTYKSTLVGDRVGPVPAGDVFLGTWRQNEAKATHDPPHLRIIKIDGSTFDYSISSGHYASANLDGKEYKADNGRTTIQVKRIDAQTIEIFFKNDLDVSVVQAQVKGNTLIWTTTGTGAQGKPFKRVEYYERVK